MASLVRNLVERRVPHSVALYIGVSWGCLQFTHFIVNEFLLSPHWTRVVLSTVLLFLPSVLMLAWFHGRPGRNRVTLTEKVGIPVNLAAGAVVLALMFSGTDLGAAVTPVSVENEDGETVDRSIPKAEFRKRTAVFPFDNGPGLGEDDAWMSFVASEAITFDLLPDDFFDPVSDRSLLASLSEAGFSDARNVPLALKREVAEEHYAEFLVSGIIDRTADLYQVTLYVHGVDSGSLIEEHHHEGTDLLDLIDELTIDLKATLDIPPREVIEDLPVRERLTGNDPALEAFGRALQAGLVDSNLDAVLDDLREATSFDPTFAYAQWVLGESLRLNNQPDEAAVALRAALDHSYRLPERVEFIVKTQYYAATEQLPKAWALVEMWAELYPEDPIALTYLLAAQQEQGELEGMLATLRTLYALAPRNADYLKRIGAIQGQLGQGEEALATLGQYVERFPEDYTGYTALAGLHQRAGEYERARERLDRAILLEPDSFDVVRAMARVDLNVGRFTDARSGYERALSLARTPRERAEGHAALRGYFEFRGEMTSATDALSNWRAEYSTFATPLILAQSQTGSIPTYFAAGRGDEAIALVENLKAQLQPVEATFDAPAARFHVPHLDLHLAIELEDLAAARDALDRTLQGLAELEVELETPGLAHDRGRIEELAGDHAAALTSYRRAAELARTGPNRRSVGRTLRALGRLDEAEAEVREALRLSPASPDSHLEMAYVLEQKGNVAGAVEHLRAALAAWENADEVFQPARDAREMLAELGGQELAP